MFHGDLEAGEAGLEVAADHAVHVDEQADDLPEERKISVHGLGHVRDFAPRREGELDVVVAAIGSVVRRRIVTRIGAVESVISRLSLPTFLLLSKTQIAPLPFVGPRLQKARAGCHERAEVQRPGRRWREAVSIEKDAHGVPRFQIP